jgi:hypothetical protein
MTKKTFLTFLVLILTPILLFILGIVYGVITSSGRLTFWRSLGSPSEKVSKILGLSSYDIFVETESGKIYKVNFYSCKWGSTSCWTETELPEISEPVYNQSCWYDFVVSNPPGTAIQTIRTKDCSSGGVWQTNLALMADSKIRIWSHDVSDLEPGLWIYYGGRFAIIGFIVTVIVVTVLQSEHIYKYFGERLKN